MMRMRMSEAARAVGGVHQGADVTFAGVGTDSRALASGALFVALRGRHWDGHDFVEAARGVGAAGAMLERAARADALPRLVVDDVRRALGCLVAAWRQRFELPVVGVTGSNGKTTVKEMLAAILGLEGAVLATGGNLNNDLGLPLTLAGLTRGHRAAVLEMGANHAGEIARLAEIARPSVGVLTQCAPAHLEGFGSVEGAARAKGELIAGLGADGVAVINADDAYAGLWRELAGPRRCITFGLRAEADVHGVWRAESGLTLLRLETPVGPVRTALALPGRHNVLNALAATAGAIAAGAGTGAVEAGLAAMRPVSGRLELKRGLHEARVIDDTYNANPASLEAALEVLAGYAGRRWLVLGDMGELGPEGPRFHEGVAASARAHGVERLYATGDMSRRAAEAFGEGGCHFDVFERLAEAVRADLDPEVTVLVKGSRAARMERVVSALTGGM